MNKKIVIICVLFVVVIAGIFFVFDRMKYTTFQDEVLDEFSVDDIYSLGIDRNSDDASTRVYDKELIEDIFEGFSDMELKKENKNNQLPFGDYTIRIYTNNSSNYGFQFFKDEKIIWISRGLKESNYYKIINDGEYLDIFENENFKWDIK